MWSSVRAAGRYAVAAMGALTTSNPSSYVATMCSYSSPTGNGMRLTNSPIAISFCKKRAVTASYAFPPASADDEIAIAVYDAQALGIGAGDLDDRYDAAALVIDDDVGIGRKTCQARPNVRTPLLLLSTRLVSTQMRAGANASSEERIGKRPVGRPGDARSDAVTAARASRRAECGRGSIAARAWERRSASAAETLVWFAGKVRRGQHRVDGGRIGRRHIVRRPLAEPDRAVLRRVQETEDFTGGHRRRRNDLIDAHDL